MGFKYTDGVFDDLEEGILVKKEGYSPLHQLVFLHMAEWANNETGLCYPSIPTIARRSWVSENTVRRIIRDLERDGFVETEFRDHLSSSYTLRTGPKAPRGLSKRLKAKRDKDLMLKGQQPPPSEGPVPTTPLGSPHSTNRPSHEENGSPPLREGLNPLLNTGTLPVRETQNITPMRVSGISSSTLEGEQGRDTVPVGVMSDCGGEPPPELRVIKACFAMAGQELKTDSDTLERAREILEFYSLGQVKEAIEFAKEDRKFWQPTFRKSRNPVYFLEASMATLIERVTQRREKAAARRSARKLGRKQK